MAKKKALVEAEPPYRNRVKRHVRMRAGDLVPNEANWRTHPGGQADALKAVYEEVGFARSLLAYEMPDGRLKLIDGHLRRDLTPDMVVEVEVLDVNEDEAKKVLATLDPLSAMAGADGAKLDALLKEVGTDSPALRGVLDGLLAQHPPALPTPGAGGDDFDATPEGQGPTRTKVGELWLIGGKHRLLVGDCTVGENVERLMGDKKADLIVADPPYGVNFKRGQFITDPSRPTAAARGVGDDIANDHRKAGDQQEFMREVFSLTREHARPACSVYMWSATLAEGSHSMLGLSAAGVHIQSQLIWLKNNLVLGIADYHWKHEVCWYGWYEGAAHRWFGERTKTTVLEFNRVGSTEHPNEKPVTLIASMIENSSLAKEVVYDPFLGSGTALIAAHRLNRTCCGCELDPRYADVILRRCEAEGLEVKRLG